MITDTDIKYLLKEVAIDLCMQYRFDYKPPTVHQSGHGLNFENDYILGTFVVWSSGHLDWNVYEIETEREIAVGHVTLESFQSIRDMIEKLLKNNTR